jgi:hypothetical protein
MPLILWRDQLFYTLSIIIVIGLAFGIMLTLGVASVLYSIFFSSKSEYIVRPTGQDKKHIILIFSIVSPLRFSEDPI